MLSDLATIEATNVDDLDLNWVAGWWHAHEAPTMCPASAQTSPDFVADYCDVLNRDRDIGQGAMQIGDEPFHAFCSRRTDPRLMLDEVRREQVVHDSNVALRETNLDESSVRFRIHLVLRYADSWGCLAVLLFLIQRFFIQYSDNTSNYEGSQWPMSADRAKRRYDSTRRAAQAKETRRQILEVAYRLFTTRGYAGTTMESLANEAGVAVETVYSAFGTKREVLARLVDRSLVGDDEPTHLLDRPGPQSVHADRDQRRQISAFARDMATIMGRVGPLFAVMRAAAPTEPEIAELLKRLLSARREGMAVFVGWVAHNGPLRAGLPTEEAVDTVWTLSSAEVHQLLTRDRGWTAERYAQWLTETLTLLLLPAAVAPST